MIHPTNKTVALIIDVEGPILKGGEENQYRDSLFPALKALSEEGRYHLFLYAPQKEYPSVVPFLERQKIRIEKLITSFDEIEYLDRDLSIHLTEKEGKLKRTLFFTHWDEVLPHLLEEKIKERRVSTIERSTKETQIRIRVDLDGSGKASIESGIPFFDHMLDQIARHGSLDLELSCKGDLAIDEHHTVEDIAIVFGEAIREALGDKRGISRYGFELTPMDEVLAEVALDFSNRPWFVWNVEFSRSMVGTFPTELLTHFYKSFSDEARCTLHMSVTNGNTHHQAEALSKGFARALRRAIKIYGTSDQLPTTKGLL